jgi:hypothetical protein
MKGAPMADVPLSRIADHPAGALPPAPGTHDVPPSMLARRRVRRTLSDSVACHRIPSSATGFATGNAGGLP